MPHNLHFDFLAPHYDRFAKPGDVDVYRDLLHLPAAGWLLDVGGGTGRISGVLQGLVEQVVLCDLSLAMLRTARRNGLRRVVNGKAITLPFAAQSFARILVVDALHHFDDQPGTVRSLLRALAPGGVLLIEEPDISRPAVKVVALLEKIALMDSHMHTAEEIRRMGEMPGIEPRIVQRAGFSVRILMEKSALQMDGC